MGAAITSEFRKFFTTRMWWGMAIGIFLAGAAFAVLLGFALTSTSLGQQSNSPGGAISGSPTQIANSVYTGGISIGYTLLLVIGVLQIGSEYRHKTITSTFLSTPRRTKAMLAKVVALLGIGVIYGLISLVGSVAAGAIVLSARGAEAFPSTQVLRSLALSLLVLGLWALIGLAIGILIPNQVAAILLGVGFAQLVEPLLNVGLMFWTFGREHIAQFLPSMATSSMVSGVTQTGAQAPNHLEWWAASLVLIGYAALLTLIGIWRTNRQDIS